MRRPSQAPRAIHRDDRRDHDDRRRCHDTAGHAPHHDLDQHVARIDHDDRDERIDHNEHDRARRGDDDQLHHRRPHR